MLCLRTTKRVCGAISTAVLLAAASSVAQAEWQGPWAGLGVGYKWLDTDIDRSQLDIAEPRVDGRFGEPRNTTGTPLPTGQSFSGDGFTAGVLAGYNVRHGSYVFSLEGDFDFTNVSGSDTIRVSSVADFAGQSTGEIDVANREDSCRADKDMNFEGSLRARAGYLVSPKLLVFVTAGLAVAQVDHQVDCQTTTTFFDQPTTANLGTHTTRINQSDKQWEYGFTVGGGAEAKLHHGWSMRFDYAYVDLSERKQRLTIDRSSTVANYDNTGATSTTYKWDEDYHKIRLSLIYKFGKRHVPLK